MAFKRRSSAVVSVEPVHLLRAEVKTFLKIKRKTAAATKTAADISVCFKSTSFIEPLRLLLHLILYDKVRTPVGLPA